MTALANVVVEEIGKNTPHQASITIHSLGNALADKALIKQVLTNYLLNAVKYSSKTPSPFIEIKSTGQANKTVYAVSDNGAGFDMQYVHKLFGVFQRLHNTDEFEGTGVGLAIVKRIVTRHGGEVWAEAEPGKGATFYFSLPV